MIRYLEYAFVILMVAGCVLCNYRVVLGITVVTAALLLFLCVVVLIQLTVGEHRSRKPVKRNFVMYDLKTDEVLSRE